jgi:RNA polymerase primary sigma factor|tara:strand:- start:1477 stop:2394 length:918 start_codon:yes stop_codon:yes gene_type:complete
MAKSDDPLTRYLSEIGKIPLLTPAEEIDLAKVVQSWLALKEELSSSGLAPTIAQRKLLRRGERACERMITANLRLVVVIAKRYYAMQRDAFNFDLLDMIQEGSVGLKRAVEKFDPTRGYKFSTYAYWWIRQSVTRAVAVNGRLIRLPMNNLEVIRKLKDFIPEFYRLHNRMPTDKECAEVVPPSADTVRHLLNHLQPVYSLDCNAKNFSSNEELSTLIDLIGAEDSYDIETEIMVEQLPDLLGVLTNRERYVIERIYGFNNEKAVTVTHIAREAKVSRQYIQQVQKRALKKMHKWTEIRNRFNVA